jgi:hypothetical protein
MKRKLRFPVPLHSLLPSRSELAVNRLNGKYGKASQSDMVDAVHTLRLMPFPTV